MVLAELQGGRQALELSAVINAFEVPKISYDPVGRKLYTDPKPRTIFSGALVNTASEHKKSCWISPSVLTPFQLQILISSSIPSHL